MVREDILGALKTAIDNGNTLGQAMQSLYNAGYPKNEIDLGAKEYRKNKVQDKLPNKPGPAKDPMSQLRNIIQKKSKPNKSIAKNISKALNAKPNGNKKVPRAPTPKKQDAIVSSYSNDSKKPKNLDPKNMTFMILLASSLILLLGGLIGLLIFKNEVVSFISRII